MPAKDYAARLEANRRWRAANPDKARDSNRKARKRYHEALKERRAMRREDRPQLDAIDATQAHMTYEEIAAKLGISRARVGQLVASGLRKLKAAAPEELREFFG